jgi:hypothetical protein
MTKGKKIRNTTRKSKSRGPHVNLKLKHKEEIVFNFFAEGFLKGRKLSNSKLSQKFEIILYTRKQA